MNTLYTMHYKLYIIFIQQRNIPQYKIIKMLEIFNIISDFSFTLLYYTFSENVFCKKKTHFSNLTFKINYYDEITKFRNMPTSLCCLVCRDMCDRYPEQISGKFPQRERKKQIPIHLMKVRALKARKGGGGR